MNANGQMKIKQCSIINQQEEQHQQDAQHQMQQQQQHFEEELKLNRKNNSNLGV